MSHHLINNKADQSCRPPSVARILRIPPTANVDVQDRNQHDRRSVSERGTSYVDVLRVENKFQSVVPHSVSNADEGFDQDLSDDHGKSDEVGRNDLENDAPLFRVVGDVRVRHQRVAHRLAIGRRESANGLRGTFEFEEEMPHLFDPLIPHENAFGAFQAIRIGFERNRTTDAILE